MGVGKRNGKGETGSEEAGEYPHYSRAKSAARSRTENLALRHESTMILYALCIVLIQRFCPLQVEPNERCKKGYRHKRYRPRNNLGREGHLARALMKGTRGELELSLFVCLLRCFHRPLSLVGRRLRKLLEGAAASG